MIGTFGTVKFIASEKTIKTFRDFKRNGSARWALHDIHLKQPVPEYIGPGQSSITFTMDFDVMFGLNPRKELDRLAVLNRRGDRHRLVIGGKGIGVGYWYIESMDQEWTHIDNNGNVLKASVQLTLKEYV